MDSVVHNKPETVREAGSPHICHISIYCRRAFTSVTVAGSSLTISWEVFFKSLGVTLAGSTVTPERSPRMRLPHARSASCASLADARTRNDNCVHNRRDTYCTVHQQRRLMHFSVFKTFLPVWLYRVPDAAALRRCLSRYTGYPCVSMLLTNWLLYDTRQHRHRHQLISRHCSVRALDHCGHHCGQATHRGWPFLELE